MSKRKKHENAKYAETRNARYMREREMRDICENAKCAIYVKMRNVRKCENAKIANVAVLQQVQYKVLQYGLYTPIET
jgi:hypothetical protein